MSNALMIQQTQPEQGNTIIHKVQEFLDVQYKFTYNINTNRILFKRRDTPSKFEYLTDYEFNSILKNIKKENILCSRDTLRTILFSDFVAAFNPYLNYFNNLPKWDGKDYISLLAESVTVTEVDFWKFCLKKWLVALVGSLIDDKVINHTAIIFSGEQGIGKTTWFRSILPLEFQEYIYEGYVPTKDKETQIKISECALILMDELENMSSKNVDSLKQLITQQCIYLRRAYTTISQAYIRRASFAGTVNHKQFLYDMTGNRRFLCFDVESFNLNHQIPHNQLYAQLLHLFRTGFQYWFNEEEIAQVNIHNNQFRAVSAEEEVLTRYFEPCDENDATIFLATTEIQQLLVQKSDFSSLSVQNLGHVLRGMKFLRLKRQGAYVYALKEKHTE